MKPVSVLSEEITYIKDWGKLIQIDFDSYGWIVSRQFALLFLLLRKIYETEPRTRKLEN